MESEGAGIELILHKDRVLDVPFATVDTDTDTDDSDDSDDSDGSDDAERAAAAASVSVAATAAAPSPRQHLLLVAVGLFAVVFSMLLVASVFYRAGNSAITSKLKSTLELAGRAVAFRMNAAVDSDAYRLTLLSDALSRGLPLVTNISQPGSVLIFPEREARIRKSDFFWITAMTHIIPQASSVYYAAEHTQEFQAAFTDYNSGEMFVLAQASAPGAPLVKFPKMNPANSDHTLDHEMKRNDSAGVSSPGVDFSDRPWYIAAKAAGDAALASNRSTGHNGKDALPAVWALYKDHEDFSGSWTLTHAQAFADRSGAAAAAAAPGEAASIAGAVGVDYGIQVVHDIIAEIESKVFRSQIGESATITIFVKRNESEGDDLLILASSDTSVQAKINVATDIAGLSMPSFAATDLSTPPNSIFLDIVRISAEQAALFGSERQSKTADGGRVEAIINVSATSADKTVSFRGEIDHYLLTVIALDHMFGGAYVVVAIKTSHVYGAEHKAWVSTGVLVLLTILFVMNAANKLWIDEPRSVRVTNSKSTISRPLVSATTSRENAMRFDTALSRAVGAVLASFGILICVWFILQNAAMTTAARRLTEQLNMEISHSLSYFIALPPVINRMNYVLHSLGALPLGYFPDSFEPLDSGNAFYKGLGITRKQLQIHADATFSDEMRRANLFSRPYFVYAGAGPAFNGINFSPEFRNFSTGHNLGFQAQSIDGSTGSKIGTGALALSARRVHGIQYSLGGKDGALYTRDASPSGFLKVSYGYNPSRRPWYLAQREKPDYPTWSEPYLFSSGFTRTIGISATQCYMCPGSRNFAALMNDSESGGAYTQEIVLSVDYTLDGISSRLNSTMENLRRKFPERKFNHSPTTVSLLLP